MRIKKFILVFLAFIFIVGISSCGKSSEIVADDLDDFGYKIENDKFEISLVKNNKVTKILIPNGVTGIADYAFSNCTSLKNINLQNNITSIGEYAFFYCTSLESVNIPNSIISIGDNPFVGYSSLKKITVNSDNNYYDSRNDCNAIIETETDTLIIGCKKQLFQII